MEREMSTGWAPGGLYGDSLGTALVIGLLKKYGETEQSFPEFKGGLAGARFRLVLSYMRENLHRDIRLPNSPSPV
jgi:hypothetical protein